ncbi:MAG: hypothetical protein JOZ47_10275 [Kutzneria sp.]|nr:hypothetical protein [Kutzneria sp.]
MGSDETTLSCTDEGIFEGDGFPTEAAAKDEAKNDLKLWIIRQRRVCEPEQNWILQAGKEAGVTGWVGIATAHGCHG